MPRAKPPASAAIQSDRPLTLVKQQAIEGRAARRYLLGLHRPDAVQVLERNLRDSVPCSYSGINCMLVQRFMASRIAGLIALT